MMRSSAMGLSPHLRGSRRQGSRRAPRSGPIPAPAGQPHADEPDSDWLGAYPRTCGAAASCRSTCSVVRGLSPHLRGSPAEPGGGALAAGPIPAPAGQPVDADDGVRPGRAYPRTCGAARITKPSCAVIAGLSPHLRGSPFRPAKRRCLQGPIPAPAGQPGRQSAAHWRRKAYPRTCGAATSRQRVRIAYRGLSPHLRGSPRGSRSDVPRLGPIPAPAGQPRAADGRETALRAYPRTCGAAFNEQRYDLAPWGLSPHLRGSRASSGWLSPSSRPIPAPAGQPTAI